MKRIVVALALIISVVATASVALAQNRPIFDAPMNHKTLTGRG